MSITNTIAVEPPHKLSELMYAYRAGEALKSAVQLEIFDKLSIREMTAQNLAQEISADSHAVELLLNAITSIEMLEKNGEHYSLTQSARHYLCKESPLFMGGLMTDERLTQAWSQLSTVVKSGKPLNQVNKVQKAEEFFPKLAASIFPLNYGTAHAVASELNIEQFPSNARVLDVAAGSAVWSLPLAERKNDLHVDAIDFPIVLDVTREFAERHGVASRFSYIAGNWSDCKLGVESYDVILLGHILHSEGRERSQEMLTQCHHWLKKGGKLVIAEMISDDDFSRHPAVQLFALNMLMMTEKGCVFSEGELFRMCAAAGFDRSYRPALNFDPGDSPIIIATK